MRSRFEPVGEAESPQVGLLDQVLGVRGPTGQVEREVVESIEVSKGLLAEGGVDLWHPVALRPATLTEGPVPLQGQTEPGPGPERRRRDATGIGPGQAR